MDIDCESSQEILPDISSIIIKEVPNSQNPINIKEEYNPFLTQSQQLSQLEPSNQILQSQSGSSNQDSQPSSSNCLSFPEFSGENSEPVVEFSAGPIDGTTRRRRGRPPMSTFGLLKATRGSQRTKKCPKPLDCESLNIAKSSLDWSEEDKRSFLEGCMKVGIKDVKGIKSFVPHKSESEVKDQIDKWKNIGRKRLQYKLATGADINGFKAEHIKNLNGWIERFKQKARESNAPTTELGNFFSILAEYGDFPPPEKCAGVDFKAIYRCFHCMMNGLPPYGLNVISSKALLSICDNVMEMLDDPEMINSMKDNLLDHGFQDESFTKTYSRKGKNFNARNIEKILSDPAMNPLKLPEYTMKKVSESSEESDEDNY